jgi:hypothetical protein
MSKRWCSAGLHAKRNPLPSWFFAPALLTVSCLFFNLKAAPPPAPERDATAPFSLSYTLDYGPVPAGAAVAACQAGFPGMVIGGHFNAHSDLSRDAIRWLAHLDAPDHVHWAVRVGDESAGRSTELACRDQAICAVFDSGPNIFSVGKFDAESLASIKTVEVSLPPALNEATFELDRGPSLPVVTGLVQDGGESIAAAVLSQDIEVTLNRVYSIPAFATSETNTARRWTRCRLLRVQDGSGYYLVIADVQPASNGTPDKWPRLGILRLGPDGALLWSRIYSFRINISAPLLTKVTTDSALLAAAPEPLGKSLLVKIAPDGKEAWAKTFGAPGLEFNDFHCDATPYRFIRPNLKVVGASQAHGLPQIILLALDYSTGAILYQTQFPTSFPGFGEFSEINEGTFYLSTFGMQVAKMQIKRTASVCRFDDQLHFMNAKEVLGAQSAFPFLSHGSRGMNLLSFEYPKPFRGVASAVNDSLEPVDLPCPWTRDLRLVMDASSYSAADVASQEGPLGVEVGPGAAAIQSKTFKLVPLALKFEKETAPPAQVPLAPRAPVATRGRHPAALRTDVSPP